ncbi:hypothetical protein FRUB_00872 [Fimbriiglobus ruber]|uniref:Uncharacterized protein n=1 Tax=Fimbriiglobus ruber TaxID=1908690 RepID=A0A225E1S3_9BACT|nr:hypothetical protein FRUB_00872 [Fimbriiglobus ruber]
MGETKPNDRPALERHDVTPGIVKAVDSTPDTDPSPRSF